ncbi:hypothetical protein FQN57_001209 [Myotisia sp. PD_48]|nr:hypothetical protein FQN57_001209 [Myotisia sp. PD_48]
MIATLIFVGLLSIASNVFQQPIATEGQSTTASADVYFRQSSNGTYNGWYLKAFHVAAGVSVTTLGPNREDASPVKLLSEGGFRVGTDPTIPYDVVLYDIKGKFAPEGYKVIAIDATAPSQNEIRIRPSQKVQGAIRLRYVGENAENIIFAACLVEAIPRYESEGPQVEIFWLTKDIPIAPGCEEVELLAFAGNLT